MNCFVIQSFLLYCLPTTLVGLDGSFLRLKHLDPLTVQEFTQPELAGIKAPPIFWVPTVFSLWHLNGNSSLLDSIYLDVLAKLAADNIATPQNPGLCLY
jgi:hypothetical protein